MLDYLRMLSSQLPELKKRDYKLFQLPILA